MHERAAAAPDLQRRPSVGMRRAYDVVALVAVLAVSFIVRIRYAEHEHPFDEIWNIAMTVGRGSPAAAFAPDQLYLAPRSQVSLADAPSAWRVWTNMKDRHPPLYCFTLRWWRDAFGESSAVAQAYTIAWSGIFAAFAFATARITMGLTIASLLGLAQALAPTQVYLAQEIRDYEMLVAIGAITLWCMTRIEVFGPSRRRALVLGLMPFFLLLTHYFALGAVIAVGLFGMWRLKGSRRVFAALLCASTALYATLWIPFAIQQLDQVPLDDFVHVDHRNLPVELLLASTAPYRQLIDKTVVQAPQSVLGGLLLVVPWFLTRRLPSLRPWALWLACSVAVIVVLDEVRSTIHLGFARYAAVAASAVLPLAAGIAYAIRREIGVVVAAALAVLAGYELRAGAWIANDCPVFEPATRFVRESAVPGEGVFVFAGYAGPSFALWMMLQCGCEPGLFPRPTMNITHAVAPDVVRRMPQRAWLITPPFDGPIDSLIPSARIRWAHDVNRIMRVNYIEIPDGMPLDPPTTVPAGVSSR